jgi:hypothetical protein
VPQIGEFANGVWKTSKHGGTRFISLFSIGVFTSFNCGLVTTQDISIVRVPQIEKSTYGIWKTSKLGGTGLFSLFPIGVFT